VSHASRSGPDRPDADKRSRFGRVGIAGGKARQGRSASTC